MLSTFASSTWSAYSRAWQSFVLSRRIADEESWPPSATAVLHHIQQLALSSASGRPESAVRQLQAALSFLDKLGIAKSPWSSCHWFQLAVRGILRAHTRSDKAEKASLDVRRVIVYLAQQHRVAPYQAVAFDEIRNRALAAAASVIPSRRQEWASLATAQVVLSLPPDGVGIPARRIPLLQAIDRLISVDQLQQIDFDIDVRISLSKTDKIKRRGFTKPLYHPAGEPWSPALLLAQYASARAALVRSVSLADSDPFFCTSNGEQLAPASISARLADVALKATGERCTSHSYRSGAASYLLSLGVSAELVAALGGWASSSAIIQHYVRHHRPADRLVRAMVKAGTPSSPPSRLQPSNRSPQHRIVSITPHRGPLPSISSIFKQMADRPTPRTPASNLSSVFSSPEYAQYSPFSDEEASPL